MRIIVLAVAVSQAALAAPKFEAGPAAVKLNASKQAFQSLGFDTGWAPSSGPIQVRFKGDVGGGITMEAPGTIHLGWSPARQLWPTSLTNSGKFSMNLGVEVSAQMKVDVKVPPVGPSYNYEGDIPYAPNFDVRFADLKNFTPYLLSGSTPVTSLLHDDIPAKALASIPLTQAILPIPGVSGTLDFKLGGVLDATLKGKRLIFPSGDITTSMGVLNWFLPTDARILSSVRYEAELIYKLKLNLQPAVTLHVGPGSWTLASFTLPVDVPQRTETWVTNTQNLSFDLPKLDVSGAGLPALPYADGRSGTVDLGLGNLGDTGEVHLTLSNTGRAAFVGNLVVSGTGFSTGPGTTVSVDPGKSADVWVKLTRGGVGTFSGKLIIDGNDPAGAVTLTLKGEAVESGAPVTRDAGTPIVLPDGGLEYPDTARVLDNGCGCGATPSSAGLAALSLLAAAWSRRRRARV